MLLSRASPAKTVPICLSCCLLHARCIWLEHGFPFCRDPQYSDTDCSRPCCCKCTKQFRWSERCCRMSSIVRSLINRLELADIFVDLLKMFKAHKYPRG